MKPVNAYNRSEDPQTKKCPESRTQQHFENETNINKIMDRIKRGQQVPLMSGSPLYGDFTNVGSYHECLIKVQEAQEEFMALPAKLRDEFDNDPGKLIDFLADEKNLEKAIELGLVEKKKEEEPMKVFVTNQEVKPPEKSQPGTPS